MLGARGEVSRAAAPVEDRPQAGAPARPGVAPRANAPAPAEAAARAEPPRAAPATDSPPPGTVDYRLGPGDIVKIAVYNNPDLATEAEVAHDGTISFPLVGQVALGGLTRAGAEKAIAERLDSGGFVPKPHVNLLIAQYRSQQVAVMGEVNKPGKYPVSHGTGVADLLAMAGGITAKGAQVINVIQKDGSGRTVEHKVDVQKLLVGSDGSRNIRLGNEDIVVVPPMPVFYIYGEVRQPGSYPLAPDMTVRQALSLGGGLTPRGTERGIQVDRKAKDGKVRTYRAQMADRLQAGDVLQVPESWF
jgi:polysaccharide export outer membrane protein